MNRFGRFALPLMACLVILCAIVPLRARADAAPALRWSSVPTGTNEALDDIAFVNPQTGWAVGSHVTALPQWENRGAPPGGDAPSEWRSTSLRMTATDTAWG